MVRCYLDADVPAAVAQAMSSLPRHWFVPSDMAVRAYDDSALPIGSGQTISQPRVVATMLAALALVPGMRVLDVGAGSGYASALLARLVAPGEVLAIERQQPLYWRTRALLSDIAGLPDGIPRGTLQLRLGDGLEGAAASAPFDAIHVACACPQVPQALVSQLAVGGRLVLPVGDHGGTQQLSVLTRLADGSTTCRALGAVLFVPALPGVAPGPERSA